MEFFDKIIAYFNLLEYKRFYQYCFAFLSVIIITCGLIIFKYYRSISYLKNQIESINEERENIQSLLSRAQIVKKEQKEIDAIITKDPNFKIAGYFDNLLGRLGLMDKKSSIDIEISTPTEESKYQESILQAKFTSMTMKDLTILLEEIESNRRVFIKELDIFRSQKNANTIDVTLTIATLEPKPKE